MLGCCDLRLSSVQPGHCEDLEFLMLGMPGSQASGQSGERSV